MDGETTHPTTERVARAGHEAIDWTKERAERAEDRAREMGRRMSDQTRQMTETLAEYVDQHPFTALGIAAGIGFLLGAIVRR